MQSDNFGNDLPQAEESINLRHYWHVVLERRWLVITAFFSVFALCLIYLFKVTPIYQATARLQIDKEFDSVLNVRDGGYAMDTREQDYMVTQFKNLQSRTLMQTVISRLKLDKDDRYGKSRDPAAALVKDITIAPIRLSRLVEVKAEHPDPETATKIANTLVDSFVKGNLDRKRSKSLEFLKWLKDEEVTLENKVKEADREIQRYREKNKMVSLSQEENILRQALMQAQQELDKSQTESTTINNLADEVKKLRTEGQKLETIPRIASEPNISAYRKELNLLEVNLAGLKKRYRDKWPEVIATKERIETLRTTILAECEKVYASIQNEAQLARSKVKSALANVEARSTEILQLSKTRVEFSVLERHAEQAKLLYTEVLKREQEVELSSRDAKQNMHLVDEAIRPFAPIKPKTTLTVLLGVVGGLAVGLGLAFFANFLDDSIKSQDDIETYLKLPFLGYIQNIKTNSVVERDLQAHLQPRSNSSEAFRTVRAAIALGRNADKLRVTAVTSTIPSEGKSLVTSNLAIVTAQTGFKTLLVDCDLRRPSVHKAFQLQSPIGLAAYLSEKVNTLDEIVHTSEIPNLDVICCGATPSNPSELVASPRMSQFLKEVSLRYDRVYLDCPPVSAVSDPLVVAASAHGVVFVTKFNKIRREHAQKTVRRIQDAGVNLVGVVLNDIDFEGRDSYYYSYYYYQNRYYASHYSNQTAAEKKTEKAPKVQQS